MEMVWLKAMQGVLLPFAGTALGAALVLLMRGGMSGRAARGMSGFAAGIMTAASFYSLLVPAVALAAETMDRLAFVPAAAGLLAGMLLLLALDLIVPHIHRDRSEEGLRSALKRSTKLVLAVTIHNLPEGMAVGIVLAGWLYGGGEIAYPAAMALSLGIALQNLPEGAIVSVPLRAQGVPLRRALLLGMLSGAVEPLGAALTIAAAGLLLPVMPYLLGFAAGAMFYVVVEELIPEMAGGGHSNIGAVCFALGFTLMMALDVGLG